MNKILCPTDFSAHATNAIDVAIRLTNKAGCNLHLIHVYQVYRKSDVIRSMDGIIRAERFDEMKKLINGVIPLMTNDSALESTLIKGDPIQIVANYAESHSYDIIIMGTQGSSSFKEIFLGSITNGVMRRSMVPVMAIPDGWTYRSLERIAIAVAGPLAYEDTDFQIIKKIASLYNSRIDFFHIDTGAGNQDLFGPLLPHFNDFEIGLHTIRESSVMPAIGSFIAEHKPDLLCMIHEKRSFFEELFSSSVTSRELFNSEIPMLILKTDLY